jgi:hypothetical protein
MSRHQIGVDERESIPGKGKTLPIRHSIHTGACVQLPTTRVPVARYPMIKQPAR